MGINVYSEVGRLKRVLIHRPGAELLALSKSNAEDNLFDDCIDMGRAIREHEQFEEALIGCGVETVHVSDLFCETLEHSEEARRFFCGRWLGFVADEPEAVNRCLYLDEIGASPMQLLRMVISGSGISRRSYSPLVNLYFTRDAMSAVGSGVSISSMWAKVRQPESIIMETIARYHKDFAGAPILRAGDTAGTIEGGDVMALSSRSVLAGISERTTLSAARDLAERLFASGREEFDSVICVDIPKRHSCMHLDTLMTQVDVDSFVAYTDWLNRNPHVTIFRRDDDGSACADCSSSSLPASLAAALGVGSVRMIPCDSPNEQFGCGANVLAVEPGRVIAYGRNAGTNAELRRAGVEVIEVPSDELVLGHGGPHCMSLALDRETI